MDIAIDEDDEAPDAVPQQVLVDTQQEDLHGVSGPAAAFGGISKIKESWISPLLLVMSHLIRQLV